MLSIVSHQDNWNSNLPAPAKAPVTAATEKKEDHEYDQNGAHRFSPTLRWEYPALERGQPALLV